MLRYQFYIGTIKQLYRCSETKKIKNIIFTKKTVNLLTNESFAIDITEDSEYPYFRNGILSNFNFNKFRNLQIEEKQIVTNGYSLNKYLKEKGYPLFINKETKDTILNVEISNILKHPEIVNYISEKENRYQKQRFIKERKLSL